MFFVNVLNHFFPNTNSELLVWILDKLSESTQSRIMKCVCVCVCVCVCGLVLVDEGVGFLAEPHSSWVTGVSTECAPPCEKRVLQTHYSFISAWGCVGCVLSHCIPTTQFRLVKYIIVLNIHTSDPVRLVEDDMYAITRCFQSSDFERCSRNMDSRFSQVGVVNPRHIPTSWSPPSPLPGLRRQSVQ